MTDKCGSVHCSLHWGKGLKQIIDGIEFCLENKRRLGDVAAVIVVSYAGHDVYTAITDSLRIPGWILMSFTAIPRNSGRPMHGKRSWLRSGRGAKAFLQ